MNHRNGELLGFRFSFLDLLASGAQPTMLMNTTSIFNLFNCCGFCSLAAGAVCAIVMCYGFLPHCFSAFSQTFHVWIWCNSSASWVSCSLPELSLYDLDLTLQHYFLKSEIWLFMPSDLGILFIDCKRSNPSGRYRKTCF